MSRWFPVFPIGNAASGTVDLELTNVVDGNLAKVVVWYDNEVGIL